MKLLFNRPPNNGSTELKSLLTFIDADIKFDKIKPDVITATRELIKLIGPDMYERVHEIYCGTEQTDEQKDLLYLTRYPIAINAYRHLAPSNDVAHTSNGRKMRVDSNEKQAFDWMLDRDNTALEKRYYRALDDLLEELDKIEAWRETNAFKASHRLFVRTTEDFERYFSIDSRLMLLKLQPGLSLCEQNEILPRIGRSKFDTLKHALKNADAIDDEKDIELLHLIKEACVYYSLSWGMMRLSVQLLPEGVLQAYTSDRMTTKGLLPPVKMEAEAARLAFAGDAAQALSKIEDLLRPIEVAEPAQTIIPDLMAGNNFIST